MSNFKFGQQVHGNVYSRRDSSKSNATTRRRTNVTAHSNTTPHSQFTNRTVSGSSGFEVSRFNPAYDRLEEGSVIEDWVPDDLPGINKMLRIIYTRDAICGPATDIMSSLPWSEFDLQGIKDPAIMRFFEEAAQLFGDKAQDMPAITTEYLALGRFCASLIYNADKGYWTDFVPHDSDYLTITPIPVRGFDPKLDLMLSPGVRQFINSVDYRDKSALAHLPLSLLRRMRGGQPIPLDPLNTLYIRRKTSPNDFVGTSIYTRIIPFWALEKALMNATVTAARRRAGSMLHVTIGIDGQWEPTREEMEDIAGLFIQADEDPVGAVVATRLGVDVNEIRDSGNLWKWSDEWGAFAEGKMRGLGISEALLAGDATYNNMEQARSVFTEQIRTLREHLTQQVYYKLFKILARAHGFRKRKSADLSHRVRTNPAQDPPSDTDLSDTNEPFRLKHYEDVSLKDLSQEDAMEIPEDDLIVPTCHWRKSLLPEGDREYLDLLEQIADKGVPIPLRVWAARAGYDLDEALGMLDEDAELRERIKKWKTETAGEDNAWGAVDAPPEEPFWDVGQRFLQLHKDEAKSCLQEMVNICHQPGKGEALADMDFVQRTIDKHVRGNQRKRELLGYVLMRLGVVKSLPISEETISDIIGYFGRKSISDERRSKELGYLAAMAGTKKKMPEERTHHMAAQALRSISQDGTNFSAHVKRAIRSPDLGPSAPTLYSGSTR